MCIDAFALFRWQVALVDAIASLDDPHSFEQLFLSCGTSAGSWACVGVLLRALKIHLNGVRSCNLQKGGVLFTPAPARSLGPGFCLGLSTLVIRNLRKMSESLNSHLFFRTIAFPAEL